MSEQHTLSAAVTAARQSLSLSPVQPLPQPVARMALGTPIVIVTGGIEAVIVGHSTCDCQRYEVAWFDRHFWTVRRRWITRSQFEIVVKQTAEAVASAAA